MYLTGLTPNYYPSHVLKQFSILRLDDQGHNEA